MYHAVGTPIPEDSLGIYTISPERFSEHMNFLAKEAAPVLGFSHAADSMQGVAITFDDGYYNNTLALPILEEFDVPAAFFICSDNVQQNRCFWWDVLYRELMAEGAPRSVIYQEGLALKSLRTALERIPRWRDHSSCREQDVPGAIQQRGHADRFAQIAA